MGVANIQFQELVASSGVKVHGRVSFSGVGGLRECACVGSVDYWLKLKYPITQAIRKYQVCVQLNLSSYTVILFLCIRRSILKV